MKVCALVLLFACTPPAVVPHQSALKEVEESAVAGCRKLGRFVGNSALQSEAAMEQSREQARAKAASAGATHVVVADEWQTPDAAAAAVQAYDCPR